MSMNVSQPLGPNRLTMLTLGDHIPDVDRGRQLYFSQCADCHSVDGHGTDDGPPVWGRNSYNDGAGLNDVVKLASWLKVAMPLNNANLTTVEAFDVAAFVNSQPRPRFQPPTGE